MKYEPLSDREFQFRSEGAHKIESNKTKVASLVLMCWVFSLLIFEYYVGGIIFDYKFNIDEIFKNSEILKFIIFVCGFFVFFLAGVVLLYRVIFYQKVLVVVGAKGMMFQSPANKFNLLPWSEIEDIYCAEFLKLRMGVLSVLLEKKTEKALVIYLKSPMKLFYSQAFTGYTKVSIPESYINFDREAFKKAVKFYSSKQGEVYFVDLDGHDL